MSIFDDMRTKGASYRLTEEALYAEALREIESGERRDGVWAKALAESNMDQGKAGARYIKLRVQSIRDEAIFTAESRRQETLAMQRQLAADVVHSQQVLERNRLEKVRTDQEASQALIHWQRQEQDRVKQEAELTAFALFAQREAARAARWEANPWLRALTSLGKTASSMFIAAAIIAIVCYFFWYIQKYH